MAPLPSNDMRDSLGLTRATPLNIFMFLLGAALLLLMSGAVWYALPCVCPARLRSNSPTQHFDEDAGIELDQVHQPNLAAIREHVTNQLRERAFDRLPQYDELFPGLQRADTPYVPDIDLSAGESDYELSDNELYPGLQHGTDMRYEWAVAQTIDTIRIRRLSA